MHTKKTLGDGPSIDRTDIFDAVATDDVVATRSDWIELAGRLSYSLVFFVFIVWRGRWSVTLYQKQKYEKKITLSELLDNLTLEHKNDPYLRAIDSTAYAAVYGNRSTISRSTISTMESFDAIALSSVPRVREFMHDNGIKTLSDIIEFSNTIAYQDTATKFDMYGFHWSSQKLKTPYQTLLEEVGDCDDMSLLSYTMCSIIGVEVRIVLVEKHAFLLLPPISVQEKLGRSSCRYVLFDIQSNQFFPTFIEYITGSTQQEKYVRDTAIIQKHMNTGERYVQPYTIFETTKGEEGVGLKTYGISFRSDKINEYNETMITSFTNESFINTIKRN